MGFQNHLSGFVGTLKSQPSGDSGKSILCVRIGQIGKKKQAAL